MDGEWFEVAARQQPPGIDEVERRLIRLGSAALSLTELLALLLRHDALERAAALVEPGLRWLLMQPPEALIEFNGLEPREVARVLAAGELARRLHHAPDERPRLITPHDIYQWARTRLCSLYREEFHALYLNNRHGLLRHVRIAEGAVDQCLVDPREVFAPAMACRASGIVLLHNHPSGDAEASVHDVTLTRRLKECARLLGLRIVDHLIIGAGGYSSMMERGLLGTEPGGFTQLHANETLD